jgi:hypothetical protein
MGHHGRKRDAWAAGQHHVLDHPDDHRRARENLAGVGEPPWSWNTALASVDVLHKAVYAFATGALADALASAPPPLAQRTGGHGPQGSV